MDIQEIRKNYPQYNDMTDQQLADSIHAKFYADMPKEQVYAKLGIGVEAPSEQSVPKPDSNALRDALGGFARSGMGIVSNLMRPIDYLTGDSNNARMARVNQRFTNQGYDQNSLSFKGGKLAGDVAATAPIGGALAAGTKYVPGLVRVVPGIETALRTGGMKLGTPAATTAAQVARNVATRVGSGAAVGGATAGLVDPEHVGTGMLIGGAVPPAVAAVGHVGSAVKAALIDPLVNQKTILGDTLARAVGTDNIPGLVGGAEMLPKTPGVVFSAGQRTGNPAIAAFEDALRATNPGGELNTQAISNNAALANALRGIAKDDIALSAAKQARTQAAQPLYSAASQSTNLADPTRTVNLIDRIIKQNPANKALVSPLNDIRGSLFEVYPGQQRGADAWKALDGALGGRMSSADSNAIRTARTVMDRVRKGTVDPADALAQIKGLSATSKAASDVLDMAKQYMKTPDYVLMQQPHQIMSAIDNIKAMIGKPENAFVVGQLNTVKKSLEHQLSKAAPEFRQAEQKFAQMSRPVNQMQVGQLLANKLIPSTAGEVPTRLNASSLASALRNPDQVAKTATGFKRAQLSRVMEPDQLNAINGVSSDASRIADINQLGAGFGSPTARRQSLNNFIGENLASRFPLTQRALASIGNVPLANIPIRATAAAAHALGGRINQKMAADLESMLASNPAMVKQLLLESQRRSLNSMGALPEPVLSPLLRSGLLNLGLTSASP